MREQPAMRVLADDDRQQAVLETVAPEDVGDLGTDHRAESPVVKRPRGVLTRGTAAEVATGHQDPAALRLRLIEHEVGARVTRRVVAPVGEQRGTQLATRSYGQIARGNDLIRIDVGRREHDRGRTDDGDRFHGLAAQCRNSRGSVIRPRTAAAAAAAGLASSVRAPWPWRPSKLRLLVLTQ